MWGGVGWGGVGWGGRISSCDITSVSDGDSVVHDGGPFHHLLLIGALEGQIHHAWEIR